MSRGEWSLYNPESIVSDEEYCVDHPGSGQNPGHQNHSKMLLFFLVILMVGTCGLGIVLISERRNHRRFLAQLRQNDRRRIKSALDELLQAYNEGMISEIEYQKKTDRLIDELAELPGPQAE